MRGRWGCHNLQKEGGRWRESAETRTAAEYCSWPGTTAAERGGRVHGGAEALQASRSVRPDEEMEAFADLLDQMREEERARYRD